MKSFTYISFLNDSGDRETRGSWWESFRDIWGSTVELKLLHKDPFLDQILLQFSLTTGNISLLKESFSIEGDFHILFSDWKAIGRRRNSIVQCMFCFVYNPNLAENLTGVEKKQNISWLLSKRHLVVKFWISSFPYLYQVIHSAGDL